jgi:hypothetical protein
MEAEERLKSDAEAMRRDRDEMHSTMESQLAAAKQREARLEERAAAAEQRQSVSEEEEEEEGAMESVAERLALEELLSDAQARVAELERRELLHGEEVRSAKESQQKAQLALADQLARTEAELSEERAQVARLSTERERSWVEVAARNRAELPTCTIDRKTLDREALFAQLQEVFYAEACMRLLPLCNEPT